MRSLPYITVLLLVVALAMFLTYISDKNHKEELEATRDSLTLVRFLRSKDMDTIKTLKAHKLILQKHLTVFMDSVQGYETRIAATKGRLKAVPRPNYKGKEAQTILEKEYQND